MDVQCINLLSASHISGHATHTKTILARAARAKRAKYQDSAEELNASFIPFIVTAQCDIGEQALELLRMLDDRIEGPHPDLKLLLSLEIQRATARAQIWAAKRCHAVRFRRGAI